MRLLPDFHCMPAFILYFAGTKGICQAYTACIPQIQLYGPTNFSPIIYHVARFSQAAVKEEGAQVRAQ